MVYELSHTGLGKILRKKLFRCATLFIAILLVLFFIPVPEVGQPVEELAFPSSRFIVVDGVKVHYVDEGSGDCSLLLLHGFGASVLSWRYVVGSLSRYCRVVAFDRPGFGLTERVDPSNLKYNPYTYVGVVELTRRLVAELNMTNTVLVGHSAGGGLALLFGLNYPELVSAVVLVAPAWKSRERQWYEKILFSFPLSDKYGPVLVRGLVGQLEQILRRAWYNKSLLTSEVEETYRYPLKARNWDKGLFWVLKYADFPEIEDELSTLKAPILIIHGDRDELVPLAMSTELSSLVNSTLIVMRDIGHLPHEESPQEFVEYLVEFITKIKLTTLQRANVSS